MTEIIGGPALPVREDDPFPGCDIPPVLYGTGTVFIRDPATGVDEDAGNFSLVEVSLEGSSERFFAPAAENQSALVITDLVRFRLEGDSWSLGQMERLLNQQRISTLAGDVLPLQTVREAELRQVRFVKDLELDPCGTPLDCPTLELTLWRTAFELNFNWVFQQAELTIHEFNMYALPDAVNHASQPFGRLLQVCDAVALS